MKRAYLRSTLCLTVLLHHLCLSGLVSGHENVFTSVESIKNIVRTDKKIANHIRRNMHQMGEFEANAKEYVAEQERMEDEINVIREQEEDASKAEVSQEELISRIAGNPLHAFQTIRRLSVDIHRIASGLKTTRQDFGEKLEEMMSEHDITYTNDLLGAAKGLLRLQDIYHLQAAHLARGKIRHIRTSCRLTVADCLLLGQVSKDIKRLDFYVEWTEQASNLCSQEGRSEDGSSCGKTAADLLMGAIQEHDERLKARTRDGFRVFPSEVKWKKASEQTAETYDAFDPASNPGLENNLCYVSGRIMSLEEESKLFCSYLINPDDPYVTMHRYKVEQQGSGFPHLITIYDVISPEEADFIRGLATPILTRSTVVGKTKIDREFSEQRISATAWLRDESDRKIEKISRRIQSITGLSTSPDHAEQFQVVNYGIGGMYNAHYDYLYKKHEIDAKYNETGNMGNRIITFILYLSDVELGGATAFPRVKTAVRPKKGAAAMWFNIDENMVPDERSFHGGCPVLYGSKWIANKWVLEGGQLFRRPCPATETFS